MKDSNVAVYWDFENLHASLIDHVYGPGGYLKTPRRQTEKMLDVSAVMDYIASLGDVVINRAYANWENLGIYSKDLLVYSIDLVQLFPRGSHAKNGADIRLALDALDDIYHHQHITHSVIIGGDSDYIAVAQKLKQAGRMVIGIGDRRSTNPYWARSCNEFKFYSTLLTRTGEAQVELKEQKERDDLGDGKKLLVRAVLRLLASSDTEAVRKSRIHPMMTRLDPKFDPGNYGFSTFNAFLKACQDMLRVTKGEHDELISLRAEAVPASALPLPAAAPHQPAQTPAQSTTAEPNEKAEPLAMQSNGGQPPPAQADDHDVPETASQGGEGEDGAQTETFVDGDGLRKKRRRRRRRGGRGRGMGEGANGAESSAEGSPAVENGDSSGPVQSNELAFAHREPGLMTQRLASDTPSAEPSAAAAEPEVVEIKVKRRPAAAGRGRGKKSAEQSSLETGTAQESDSAKPVEPAPQEPAVEQPGEITPAKKSTRGGRGRSKAKTDGNL